MTGALLILGAATRIVALLLGLILSATLVVFGPMELLGHLPIFAAAFALLSMGTGGRWRVAGRSGGARAKSSPTSLQTPRDAPPTSSSTPASGRR